MNSNRDYATENINLKKRLEALGKENVELQLQIEQLEDSAKIKAKQVDEYATTLKEKYLDLKQENEKLKQENKENAEFYVKSRDALWDLKQENKKLKKAIQIIKNNINHLEIQIIDGFPSGNVFIGMTQQEYNLLKDILGD